MEINLFEHQKSGIEFLEKTGKAILADEMGLGKTRMAIVASQENRDRMLVPGVLIVCPASLKINWMREIRMVYPRDEIVILSTDGEEDPDDPEKVQFFIINYDILEKRIEYISNIIDANIIDTLILDEAHYIKGKSIRAACVVGGKIKRNGGYIKFGGIAEKMKRVYCLTGTPLLNRPIEMFNLLKAINHPLGRVRTAFARKYCGAFLQTIYTRSGVKRFINEKGATNLDQLRKELSGYMLRRKKKDILDLPDKIVSTMECEMTAEWKKAYDNAWELYLDFLSENPMPEKNMDNILMARQLVEIQKLKQVCSRSKVSRIISDARNAVEQGQKVIIFSQYTETIRQIKEGIGRKAVGEESVECVTLTGADDQDARQKSVDDFQNDESVKVFIANIKAGGVGLTLTAGNIVMFADMDWSPEIHRQAEDRAHRIGQKEMVNVYYYICPGTIEDEIIDILNSKKGVMDKILEEGEGGESSVQQEFLGRMKEKLSTGRN